MQLELATSVKSDSRGRLRRCAGSSAETMSLSASHLALNHRTGDALLQQGHTSRLPSRTGCCAHAYMHSITCGGQCASGGFSRRIEQRLFSSAAASKSTRRSEPRILPSAAGSTSTQRDTQLEIAQPHPVQPLGPVGDNLTIKTP